ncbi:hypothetical protein CYMTET_49589 [Cymbomonas tetramitiformis]|uniref:Uncharacterized protein n=1 Tax=Cymbomonas tetramitiformis TaxID=36881 RepID=A0AAE0ETR3_9CHLO|nr:hypothetical protein CYMTET_49589 [Cymbomonas tetramitiformis]
MQPRGLPRCERPWILDLSNNHLGDAGAEMLADAIRPDFWGGARPKAHFRRISLANCGLGERSSRFVLDALVEMYESMNASEIKVNVC